MMELHHNRTVTTTLRLPEARHRELRMAVAKRGMSIQKALEQAVSLWLYKDADPGEARQSGVSLRGILRDTKVLEMREEERRKELARDARRS